MLNHIAVILRGHIRTWRWIYPYVFDFYDKLAYNVDYYMLSFIGSSEDTNILGSFEGRNLIACRYITPNKDFNDSYMNAAYLSYLLLPHKHKREKQVNYDIVFDTRPDVIPVYKPGKYIHSIEPDTLYITRFELHHNPKLGYYDLGIEDWFFASTSEVHDRMAGRFIEDNKQTNHITVRCVAEQNGFGVNKLEYVEAYMARPNIEEAIVNGKLDIEKVNSLQSVWQLMPREEKIKLLDEKRIAHMDYDTGSWTCSI